MDLYYRGNKVIQFVEGRIFIDVAVSGCGSNCLYCYVETKSQRQELIEWLDFCKLLDMIINHPEFETGRNGTILSLCPNTEPFKSIASTKLVLSVLDKFLPIGNLIQISSKEIIPIEILDFICSKRKYLEQVVLNISIASITKQQMIEPFTAEFSERLINFTNLNKRKIIACLYIKPVLNQTLIDVEHYINLVNDYKIKYVCIGLYYPRKEDKSTCKLLYKDKKDIEEVKLLPTFNLYKEFIRCFYKATESILVHSTICVLALINNMPPRIELWNKFPEICSNCQNCNLI